MRAPYIWFCRDCKKKGDMLAKETFDLFNASTEHKVGSPGCSGLVRIASEDEVAKDPAIKGYENWAD
jgi:hypothetical protein